MPADPRIRQLLAIIDQAYDRASWHGPNLRGSIRGVSPAVAARRPFRGRHNIWEIVVHAAYWKYVVTRRLTAAPRGSFPLKGSNWFPRDGGTRAAWLADLDLLARAHAALRQTVARLPARTLDSKASGTVTRLDLIAGVAAHDIYHAGQIQLLKKLP
jgi:uncharacterized damage-inducible protein DinB